MASLYERLGGQPAVEALAEILYDRIYSDESLKPFFEGTDRKKMEQKQVDFLADIFGGPPLCTKIDLRKAHGPPVREKGLNEEHFNLIATMVQSIMVDMHVSSEDVAEAMAAIAAFKDDVLAG